MSALGRALASSLVVALGVGAAACPADPRDAAARGIVARVGDREVTRARFLSELTWAGVARTPEAPARVALAQGVLDRIVDNELLLIGAARDGVEVADDDVAREIRRAAASYPSGTFERLLVAEQMTLELYEDRVRRRMTVDAYLRKVIDPLREIPDGDIRARYDAEVATTERPAQVLARQVLVKTEEEAQHVLKEIQGRRLTVEDAARRFSAAPERDEGGLLGWYARGELPEVFDLVFALTPGQVSDVVASDYGFHIFELIEKREKGVEPFEQAKARLTSELQREREEREVGALLERLRREVPVTVDALALEQAVAALPPVPTTAEKGPDPSPAGSFSTFPTATPKAPDEARP